MHLSPIALEKLNRSIKETYVHYCALELARTFKIGDAPIVELLKAHCARLPVGQNHPISINVNGQTIQFEICIESDDGISRKITLRKIPHQVLDIDNLALRKMSEFKDNNPDDIHQALNILGYTALSFEYQHGLINYDKPGIITNTDGHEIILGGPKKINLYTDHINTLVNILHHINEGADIMDMLANKTTGAGKTFIAALWCLVLYKAGMSGVFALDDQIPQFIQDLQRLLPDEIMQQINILGSNGSNPQAAVSAVNNLASTNTAQFIVGSHEDIFDNHFLALHACSGDKLSICVDEVHKVVKQEDRKLKLELLSEKLLSMYLTATPTEQIHIASGKKPIAEQTTKEQMEAGQGKFSKIHKLHAEKISDLRKKSPMRFKKGLVTAIANKIENEESSTVSPILTMLPFMVEEDTIATEGSQEQKDRWNKVPLLNRKGLICVGQNIDDLINLDNITHPETESHLELFKGDELTDEIKSNLRVNTYVIHVIDGEVKLYYVCNDKSILKLHKDDYPGLRDVLSEEISNQEKIRKLKDILFINHDYDLLAHPYSDGNIRDRGPVYNLMLQDSNIDKDIAKSYLDKKRQEYKKQHGEAAPDPLSVHETLDNNIFHGMIEILIRAVLAYSPLYSEKHLLERFKSLSTIDLDQRRLQNLPLLADEFLSHLQYMSSCRDINGYFNKLLRFDSKRNPNGVDEKGAMEISNILEKLLTPLLFGANSADFIRKVVDNHHSGSFLKDKFMKKESVLYNHFHRYAKRFRTLYIVKKMPNAEVPIKEKRPFNGFKQEVYPIFDEKGTLSDHAKKRKRGPTETLNDQVREYHYAPNYLDFDENIAKNYFRLGVVGWLISDSNSHAFNDENLHLTIQLVPSDSDPNMKPSEMKQARGRNRGRDKTQIDTFVQLLNKNVTGYFDVELLQKTNNYSDSYYKAERKYRKAFVDRLGIIIMKDVKDWLYSFPEDKVDEELFKFEVARIITEKMRELNNLNNHDIKLTRQEYKKVLKVLDAELKKEIEQTQEPYKLKIFIKFIAGILYAFSSLYRFFTNIGTRIKLARARYRLKRADKEDPKVKKQLTYSKIIKTHNLHDIMRNAFWAKEFKVLLDREQTAIKSIFEENIADYVVDENVIDAINDTFIQFIIPVLAKFYSPQDQQLIIEEAIKYNRWTTMLLKNKNILENGLRNVSSEEKMKILGELAKNFVLELSTSVNGLSTIQQRNYGNVVKETNKYFKAVVKHLKEDHKDLTIALEQYFKTDFLENISTFVPAHYFELMREILTSTTKPDEGSNAFRFAAFCVHQVTEESRHGIKEPGTDNYFRLFRILFQSEYPALKTLLTVKDMEESAKQNLKEISTDVNDIFTRNKGAQEQANDSSFFRSALNKVSNYKVTKAISFSYHSKEIKQQLSQYFKTALLIRLKYALPINEYTKLEKVFTNQTYSDRFADYLVSNASELQAQLSSKPSFDVMMGYFKECFKSDPFIKEFENFPTLESQQKQAARSMQNIEQQLKELQLNSKTNSLSKIIEDDLFIENLSDILIAQNMSVDEKYIPLNVLLKQLFSGSVHNAHSFAVHLMSQLEQSRSELTPPMLITELNHHFSDELDHLKVKLNLVDAHIDQGKLAITPHIADLERAIDPQKVEELAKERVLPILAHPDFLKLQGSILKDLSKDDIIVLLQAYEEANPKSKKFPNHDAVATQIIHLQEAIKKKDIETIRAFPMEDLKIVLKHLQRISSQIVDWHCQFEQTTRKGMSKKSTDKEDLNDIFTIHTYFSNSSANEMSKKFNYLQAIREALPKASEISAFANHKRIRFLTFLKTYLINPLLKAWNASKSYLNRLLNNVRRQDAGNPEPQDGKPDLNTLKTSYQTAAITLATEFNKTHPLSKEQVLQQAKSIDSRHRYQDTIDPILNDIVIKSALRRQRMQAQKQKVRVPRDSPLMNAATRKSASRPVNMEAHSVTVEL